MSRRTTRAVKRQKERRHPSIFFFIVMALGLLFLLWLFTLSIHQPPQKLGALSSDQFVNRNSAGTRWMVMT